MLWVVYSFLAALFWATASTLDKYILSKWVKNPIVSTMIFGIIGLIASILIYFVKGYSEISSMNLFLAFVGGLTYVIATILYFEAVKIEEISRISALAYFSQLFVTIFAAVFLREVFTSTIYAGILLILAGAILISSKDIAKITKIRPSKAFWLMMLSSAMIAVVAILTKYLLEYADFWTVFSYTRGIGTFIALIPVFYFKYPELKALAKEHGKKAVGAISISGIFTMLGSLVITIAASTGPVTLVNAISMTRPFFVLLFATVLSIFYPKILREELGKSAIILKVAAIILMFIGAILVA